MLKTVLLLLLTWAVSPLLSISYHIIPSSNQTTSCHFQFEACFTLQQFEVANNNQSSTLELVFAAGRHFRFGGITFGGLNEVTLRGQNDSTRQPQLTCQGSSCFSFINTSKIHIENLVFTECISEQSGGGALNVRQAESVNITQCSFIGNRVQSIGGAIRIKRASSIHILQTQFLNNSVTCSQMDVITLFGRVVLCTQSCIGYGGALIVSFTTHAVIQNSVFHNNQASRYGGALFLGFGSLSILNSTFSKNTAHCFNDGGGGALKIFNGRADIINSHLEENQGFHGGAIFSPTPDSEVMILNSSLSFNSADFFGGAGYFIGNSLQISETTFSNNSADVGGAITSAPDRQDTTNIFKSTFYSNTGSSGGALYFLLDGEPSCTASQCKDNLSLNSNATTVTITECVFKSSVVQSSSGIAIYAIKGVLNITGCTFTDQQTNRVGIVYSVSSILHLQDSEFSQNKALQGSALYLSGAVLNSLRNNYTDNHGPAGGGAIIGFNSTVFVRNDRFISNGAVQDGGAIKILVGYLSSTRCNFSNNSNLLYGGAVSVRDGEFVTNETVYESNSSSNSGGALFLIRTIASIIGAIFNRNNVSFQGGAAIFQTDGYIRMSNVTLTNNLGRDIIDMYTVQLTNSRGECNTLTLSNNLGSIYMLFSVLNFSGDITFTKNVGQSGGALTLIQSTVTFSRQSQLSISSNNATFGGAISLSQSTLQLNSPAIVMTNNRATVSGGAIYCFQSMIGIDSIDNDTLGSVLLHDNWAVEGGAINQIASALNIFKGSVLFSHNQGERGGAVHLSESSQISILKTEQEPPNNLSILLNFSNNTANYGGAVFVLDVSNAGGLCETSPRSRVRSISSNECFLQVIRLYYPRDFKHNQFNYFNIFFQDNFASSSGNDIFGGLLDRCRPSSFAEIVVNFFSFRTSSFDGITYLGAIVEFQTGIDYDQIYPYNPLTFQRIITRHHLKGLISSNSTALCFCTNSSAFSCSNSHPTITVQRGQSFSIQVVIVDQVGNPINGTVLATVLTTGTSLSVDQARQNANSVCTELFYNIFSTQVSASIQLYPDGPCGDMGISSKQLSIAFLSCYCPQGLQPAALDNECRCECSSDLNAVIDQCTPVNDNVTIVRRTEDFWIQYAIDNDSTVAGFVFNDCPFDYCRLEPINLTILLPSQADTQCANNRSGVMCGECAEGLSLVFGSSRCIVCSDNYLFLLIAFALAGIVLVTFILILNMTVAVGTIHGLILYANIIGANDPIFLPSNTALRVFVSWVNLDLGIETCFYNGMDSYAKVLLQLVFPAYIISLSVLIIIISYYWGWFGGLIGRRNPVATLCTLFLLSYSKLLRTIIASLQFVSLTFPTGLTEVLWLYNPNIYYLTPARVPIFITATVILVLGSIYTMLLFFAQWLRMLRKVKCIHNPKYIAFIDAYQAPFSNKHRYWIGILLLTRILHHLLTAVLSESTHLLTVSCLVSTLLIFKQLINRVYKNWLVDLLETSFLINLLLFAVSTYYVSIIRGDQLAVANASVIIAFITFCGIVLYHTHAFLLSDVKAYQNWITKIKSSFIIKVSQRRNNPSRSNLVPLNSRQREANNLDIISPILPRDYEVPVPPPTPTHPVTTTIVDIRELDAEQDDPEQQDPYVSHSPDPYFTTTIVDVRELDQQEEEQDSFSTPYQTY